MIFILLVFLFISIDSQTIKQLNEISIKEELPIGSIVTLLTDKIPNLEQSVEYDLVTPLSSDFDLFSIDHTRHSLNIKKRVDYEQICTRNISHRCVISISIAVSNHDTIDVYILPIEIQNIDDNPMKFSVNRTVIEIEENDENWSKRSYPLPSAIDADGDIITYSIYLQNWNQPIGLFELNQENLSLKPLKKFDREEQNLYLLRLVAKNQHEKDVSIDIIIIIKDQNDNQPQCQFNHTLFVIDHIDTISTFTINATDLDEGDNAKLEYHLINSFSGFIIDHNNGQITFDYTQWIRDNNNQSKLFVNITDHGKPSRLSTECIIQLQFTFLFDINFKSNHVINIEDTNSSIGELMIIDKQEKKSCFNCAIEFNSFYNDLFYFNSMNLYLNFQSKVLFRILSNYLIKQEHLPINLNIKISDRNNPSIVTSRNYSFILHLNKEKLLINSNILYVNILFNESISLTNRYYSYFNNQSNNWKLIDSTNTFIIDENLNLMIKNFKQQEYYQVYLKNNQCSIELRITIQNPYSILNVYPYFSQTFYILNSGNLSSFILPRLPSYVKYFSSKSNDISIDENNGSIVIRSASLYSTYSYDFSIQAIDSQTPSLSCSISIRIFFGINHQSPRLRNNYTGQSIEISSTEFLYQIEAYDPDLDVENSIPPAIEYEIESSDELIIDRYTGRIFLKNFNQSKYDFTLVLTDFGQPNRLITRQRLTFDIRSNEKISRQEISMFISRTFIFITVGIFVLFIVFILILLIYNCWYSKSSTQKSLSNLSPTTPDCRLIDNEYITTTTSLPRVINREQRVYPTISTDNQRKLLEQICLPPPPLYSAEKVFIKQESQYNLSMTDINKYLERFEKIYNNSSEQQNFRESVGSVV